MSALLELKKISVKLRATYVLKGVTLSVGAGQIIALLGPNGAGKTTLMRASLGILPAEGVRALGGADPMKLTNRERALRVAYLPQRPQATWPISVEALVALGRFAHGSAPDRLGEKDQAAVDAAIEACGLTKLRGRGMDEISGGEKARAHLARALAQHAPLILLDEPTAGLDPAQSLGVADVLRAHVARGGAVVFSTHDIALAAGAAHHVMLMHEGRVLTEGEPEKALTREALEAAYGRPGELERIGDAYVALFR